MYLPHIGFLHGSERSHTEWQLVFCSTIQPIAEMAIMQKRLFLLCSNEIRYLMLHKKKTHGIQVN